MDEISTGNAATPRSPSVLLRGPCWTLGPLPSTSAAHPFFVQPSTSSSSYLFVVFFGLLRHLLPYPSAPPRRRHPQARLTPPSYPGTNTVGSPVGAVSRLYLSTPPPPPLPPPIRHLGCAAESRPVQRYIRLVPASLALRPADRVTVSWRLNQAPGRFQQTHPDRSGLRSHIARHSSFPRENRL